MKLLRRLVDPDVVRSSGDASSGDEDYGAGDEVPGDGGSDEGDGEAAREVEEGNDEDELMVIDDGKFALWLFLSVLLIPLIRRCYPSWRWSIQASTASRGICRPSSSILSRLTTTAACFRSFRWR